MEKNTHTEQPIDNWRKRRKEKEEKKSKQLKKWKTKMNDETSDDKKSLRFCDCIKSSEWARLFLNDWLLFLLIYHINLHTIWNSVTMRAYDWRKWRAEKKEKKFIQNPFIDVKRSLCLVHTILYICSHHAHPKTDDQ